MDALSDFHIEHTNNDVEIYKIKTILADCYRMSGECIRIVILMNELKKNDEILPAKKTLRCAQDDTADLLGF